MTLWSILPLKLKSLRQSSPPSFSHKFITETVTWWKTLDSVQTLQHVLMCAKMWEPLVCRIKPEVFSWACKAFTLASISPFLRVPPFIPFHFLPNWISYYSWNFSGTLFKVVNLNSTYKSMQFFLSKYCVI